MPAYPYTLDNGAGESLTVTGREAGPRGDRLVAENRVSPGAGPPMHAHYLEDESFTVVKGRIGYQRKGEEPRYAGPGESILFPAGEPHRFWNAGDDELHCTGVIEPAGNIEYFLGAVFESQRENGGVRPNLLDAAWLSRRYRSEFTMTDIPAFVRVAVFPVLAAVGTVLGRTRKYADAPPPMTAETI